MKLDLVIVDDSALWLSISRKLAEAHPLVRSVLTFDDTLDAWVYLQTNKPSAVLTDVEMPGFDGFSFLGMFAAKMPILASSTKPGFAINTKKLGSIGFLAKPFAKKEFDTSIEQIYYSRFPRQPNVFKEHAMAI